MPDRPGDAVLDLQRDATFLRAAKTITGLGALGCGLSAATLLAMSEPHLRQVGWGWLAVAGLSALAFAALTVRRWSAAPAQGFALVVIAAVMASQVHADFNSAKAHVPFAAFDGFKIVAVAVATVLPFRPALSFALIATCAVLPVAIYQAMTPELRDALPIEEPWNTILFPLIATGILLHRIRALRVERQMLRAVADREALERVAKVSLAYRDLANSPLQALELTRAMLRHGDADTEKLLDQLERSLQRLREMGEILSHTEEQVRWTSTAEGFDAARVISEYRRGHP
jgi:hypothetical protein